MRMRKVIRRGRYPEVVFLITLSVCLWVIFVFYKNILGCVPGVITGIYVAKVYREKEKEKEKGLRRRELKDLLTAMETAVRAGESLNSAVLSAAKEMKGVYAKDQSFMEVLERMKRRIEMGETASDIMEDYTKWSGLSEAKSLSVIFRIAETTGGSTIRIMENSVDRISQKMEIDDEIEVLIREKKLELRLMILMPSLIILYLRLTNSEYIGVLYNSLFGAGLMTAALIANIAADVLGNRIISKVKMGRS